MKRAQQRAAFLVQRAEEEQTRAEVYALNRLMRRREIMRFDAYVKARKLSRKRARAARIAAEQEKTEAAAAAAKAEAEAKECALIEAEVRPWLDALLGEVEVKVAREEEEAAAAKQVTMARVDTINSCSSHREPTMTTMAEWPLAGSPRVISYSLCSSANTSTNSLPSLAAADDTGILGLLEESEQSAEYYNEESGESSEILLWGYGSTTNSLEQYRDASMGMNGSATWLPSLDLASEEVTSNGGWASAEEVTSGGSLSASLSSLPSYPPLDVAAAVSRNNNNASGGLLEDASLEQYLE